MFWYDYSSPGHFRRIQNVQLSLHDAEVNPRLENPTCRFKIDLFILSKYQVSCSCWQWQNPLPRIWFWIYSHSSRHIHAGQHIHVGGGGKGVWFLIKYLNILFYLLSTTPQADYFSHLLHWNLDMFYSRSETISIGWPLSHFQLFDMSRNLI